MNGGCGGSTGGSVSDYLEAAAAVTATATTTKKSGKKNKQPKKSLNKSDYAPSIIDFSSQLMLNNSGQGAEHGYELSELLLRQQQQLLAYDTSIGAGDSSSNLTTGEVNTSSSSSSPARTISCLHKGCFKLFRDNAAMRKYATLFF